jgi:general secretion pathway protein C
MQDLIKRYLWMLSGVVVMVCMVFVAKAANHIVEAKYLSDPEHGPKINPVVPQPTALTKPVRSKDGIQFASRDIFCSECTPAEPVKIDNGSIQMTTLPLQLLATNVAPTPEQSYATIVNIENQRQGAFGVGDKIPGASGPIKAVHYKFVDFENNGRLERIGLAGQPTPPTTTVPAVSPTDENKDDLQVAIDSGVKKLDDNNYEIDKSLVEKVLANPMGVAKGARVVPSMEHGKPNGFRLYAIQPSSVYAKLGFTNGDAVQAINGFELTSAERALEVYTKLREATSLQVEITRRGKPMTINYKIR